MKDDMSTVSWRDSARGVKFFFLPGQSVFPLFALLLNQTLIFFIIVMCISIFFAVITHFGYSPKVFFRMFKCFIAGNIIESKPWWEQ